MAQEPKHMLDEADIGSGEKKHEQRETEKEIRKIDQTGHATSDKEKEEEKRKGMVNEDNPFPPKGN